MMNHQQLVISNGGSNGNALQHFIANSHIHHDHEHPNVIVMKQEQLPHKYIINHNNQIVSHVSQPEPYWLIVDVESDNDFNSYAFIDAKDVVGQPPLKSLNTGMLVIVAINGKQRRASVVMTSPDKNFIYAEFNTLSKMAEENLQKKRQQREGPNNSKVSEENLNMKHRESQVRKRRRLTKDGDDDSSLSGWSGVSQGITSDRVLSPSAHIQQKSTKSDFRFSPPMMFDQGTQTENRLSENGLQLKIQELQKLIELNEHILQEQKSLKNEASMSRSIIQSFSDDFTAMRKTMQSIEVKVDSLSHNSSQFSLIPNESVDEKKKELNGSEVFFIENANVSNMEYTVTEFDGDDSGRSTSRMSFHDQTSMMSSTSVDFNGEKKTPFRRSQSSSNFSVHSSSSTPLPRVESVTSLIEEWNDCDGDVSIGVNKTLVPVHVLRAIDWKNYKTATRKLLTTLFTREILASRSLTGRPSPAFHDRNKPIKEQLDQKIINDIIQVVTRKCSGIQESQVRQAITTKCADENKMMRTRKANFEKENFKTPNSTSKVLIDSNKENLVEKQV